LQRLNHQGEVARTTDAPRTPGRFDAERVERHVRRLSYRRRAGTRGERRAARSIRGRLARYGLSVRRERFAVPHAARELGVRLIFAAAVVAVALGTRLLALQPLLATACWLSAGVLLNAPWTLLRGLGARWPRGLVSANVVARLGGRAACRAPARVVFMAHYDAKSQVLPTGLRVAAVVSATGLCGLLGMLGLAAALGLPAWDLAGCANALGWGVSVLIGLLAANVTGDRSPGALDNATGVGTLLELARTWRPAPDAPVEVLWVATGAEEVGLEGARHFLARHEAWLRRKPTLIVNLDSVGAGPRLYLAGEAEALGLASSTADALGIAWSRLRVLGAGMDHEPFAAHGIAAVSVLGDVVAHSLALHSRRDTPDRIDPAALQRAGLLATEIARAWAERHRGGSPITIERPPRESTGHPGWPRRDRTHRRPPAPRPHPALRGG
jgi:acetylornithine deacetylase/succinyl-diaminopimelate desuccinylase-like protein